MSNRQSFIATSGLSPDILEKFTGANAAANVLEVKTIQDPVKQLVIREAYAWSIRNMWIFYLCTGVVGIVAAAFVQKQRLSDEHTETKTGLLAMEKRTEM
jgi:hypothetical protein